MPRSTKANADLNRQRLFEEARRQFAARGFHATSIGSIAGEVGLTKQTLLHHFGSKERLFSEVLEEMAEGLAASVAAIQSRSPDPKAALAAFFRQMLEDDAGDQTQIVIRELLENRERAGDVQHWHLKGYLDSLTGMIRAIPGNETLSEAQAFARLYLMLGAVSYFRISQPTLQGMMGKRSLKAVQIAFDDYLMQLIESPTCHRDP